MVDIIAFFGTWQMQVIVTLITIDVLLGIIAALIKKEFVWGKLAKFMKGPVIAYVLGFAIVEIVGETLPSLDFIVPAAFVLVVIVLLASLFRNLSKLGIPVPDDLRK